MKRVLIICYYWPPAGGPGVQRWLKFVKYLREFDIEPIVYVPDQPHYPIRDESFLAEVPKGIEIMKTPIKEPYQYAKLLFRKKTNKISSGIIDEKDPSFLEKLMLYARGNLFIPDARVGWVKPSVRYLTSYLEQNPDIDTIITTGPPHSLHLIGMKLKEHLGLRWIADFRDPWTSIHYHKSLRLGKKAAKKHLKLEKQVLQSADEIIVTSPGTLREFEGIRKRPVHLITNGFDERPTLEVAEDSKFSLVHIGSLLSNRNPMVLWEVLKQLTQELHSFKENLEIKLVGLVAHEIKDAIKEQGLEPFVSMPGYVTHKEALQLQQAARILLLIEMNRKETASILPGKLFEYLNARRPIIALGPLGSDIAPLLKETQSGQFFDYESHAALKTYIESLYHQYLQGTLGTFSSKIEHYSRKHLTGVMAEVIKG